MHVCECRYIFNKEILRRLQNIILLSKSQRPSILKYLNILSRLYRLNLTIKKTNIYENRFSSARDDRFSSARDEMLQCVRCFDWMLHQTSERKELVNFMLSLPTFTISQCLDVINFLLIPC